MKTTVKILILVLSITLAIGVIMVYAKTRVEPPTAFEPINQFERDLNQSISKLDKTSSPDTLYLQTLDRILIFENEGRLTPGECDKQKDMLLGTFSSIFLKRCFANFDNSVWYESVHGYMLKMSYQLKSVKHSDRSFVLRKSTSDSLQLVENIIQNYNQAGIVCRNTQYRGIESARRTINQAVRFANDPYLSKCSDLKEKLNNVRHAIESSHYRYISEQVEELSSYYSYNEDYYKNTLAGKVESEIEIYDNNANNLYGYERDTKELWNKAREYYKSAVKYYNSKYHSGSNYY